MRLLLIEDSQSDAELIRDCVRRASIPLELRRVVDLRGARSALAEADADCVLLDLSLPDATGLEAVDHLVATAPDTPLVVITGMDDDDLGVQAVARGAQDYLTKGQLSTARIERAIRFAVERSQTARIRLQRARERQAEALMEAIAEQIAVARSGLAQPEMGPLLAEVATLLEQLRTSITDPEPPPAATRSNVVALRPVVDRALTLLAADVDAAGVTVTIGRLPSLEADASLLLEVMLNLLRGALRGVRAPGRIRVSAGWDVDAWIVEVADSGPRPQLRGDLVDGSDLLPGGNLASQRNLEYCSRVIAEQGGRLWTTTSDVGGTAVRFRMAGTTGA